LIATLRGLARNATTSATSAAVTSRPIDRPRASARPASAKSPSGPSGPRGRDFQAYPGLEVRLGRRCRSRPQSGPRQQRIAQEDREMRNIKTLVVAAGAAVVLGGVGVGVAQAASPGTAPTVTSSTSSTHQSHESEARGRVAEGETHARHTGNDG
jgi:hypothetical protein